MKMLIVIVMLVCSVNAYVEERYDGSLTTGDVYEDSFIGPDGNLR